MACFNTMCKENWKTDCCDGEGPSGCSHHKPEPNECKTKTPEEIEKLKQSWRNDPCWDIEDTDGFEEHRDELLAYRKEWEAHWEQQRHERLTKKATQLGVPGNTKLAAYIEKLEGIIDHLQMDIQRIKFPLD